MLMKSPATVRDEIYVLISAQLDMFEGAAPLSSAQWLEFESRAENIRMLCEEFDQLNNEADTQQLCAEAVLGESRDPLQESRNEPLMFPTRRLRPLTQAEPAEEEVTLQFAAAV
jgi:hypothetical protein